MGWRSDVVEKFLVPSWQGTWGPVVGYYGCSLVLGQWALQPNRRCGPTEPQLFNMLSARMVRKDSAEIEQH